MENNAQPPDPGVHIAPPSDTERDRIGLATGHLDPRLPPDSTSPTGSATLIPVHIPTPPNPNASLSQGASSRLGREPGDGEEIPEEAAGGVAAGLAVPALTPQVKKPSKLKRWSPNTELIDQITSLGFAPNLAEKALFYTGNRSADLAVGWLLDHPEAAEDPRPLDYEGYSSSGDLSPEDFEEEDAAMIAAGHKMVFVVNSSLKMGLGKIAAQVGHATLGLYRSLLDEREPRADALAAWDATGETKVVVRGKDDVHLMNLAKKASDANLPNYVVHDAGRTQIAAGSMTVLAIFGPGSELDRVTGGLKLL